MKYKCNRIYSYIVSEANFDSIADHLKECETCSIRLKQIKCYMAVFDEPIEVPDGLVEKTLRRKNELGFPAKSEIDYTKYLQIAAVLTAGIFLGIFLGRNADSELFLSKKEKKDRMLMEYRESHHLNNESSGSIYRF